MAEPTWTLVINGAEQTLTGAGDTPLLYVLQNDLRLQGPRFGCGLAQCGACSVLLDDQEVRACITPLSAVAGRKVTTLEGVADWYARRQGLRRAPAMHPVQQALLDEQVPQCGYCMNGIVMKAAELLDRQPHPDAAQIRSALNGHLCRCGTYPGILRAVLKVAGR